MRPLISTQPMSLMNVHHMVTSRQNTEAKGLFTRCSCGLKHWHTPECVHNKTLISQTGPPLVISNYLTFLIGSCMIFSKLTFAWVYSAGSLRNIDSDDCAPLQTPLMITANHYLMLAAQGPLAVQQNSPTSHKVSPWQQRLLLLAKQKR